MSRLKTLTEIHLFGESIMSNVFAEQLPENVKISVTLTPDEFILLVKDNRIKIKAYHAFEYHGVPGCTITVKT